MGRQTKRKVLKRSEVPVGLWSNFILVAALAGFALFWLLSGIWSGLGFLSLLIPLFLAVVSVVVLIRIWRVLTRKVVFLDKHISYAGWLGRPTTYRYEDVVDIQSVIVPDGRWSWFTEWEFEDGVKILFADGEALRVPSSAMKPREVRRRIESKTGLRFESTLKL